MIAVFYCHLKKTLLKNVNNLSVKHCSYTFSIEAKKGFKTKSVLNEFDSFCKDYSAWSRSFLVNTSPLLPSYPKSLIVQFSP